ncbi:T9SS type A sorting domain-containing protein [Rubrivirga sp.]|uniref:T9SS type A sorting domain-containing protein n=1 Tax=Rubrivirga sp. TaxID=1885344 RepID=UPI003B515FD3
MLRRLLPILALALVGPVGAQVTVQIGAASAVRASNVALALDGTLDAVGPLSTVGSTVTFTNPATGGITLGAGLGVALRPAGTFIGTAVNGTVQIQGGLAVTVVPNTYVAEGDAFAVLTCAGGCTGTFASVSAPFAVDVEYGETDVTLVALEAYVAPSEGPTTLVVDGTRGARFFGPPSAGVTVDDLAAQNLVRGVAGYYPAADPPNLWTRYDVGTGEWVASAGTGEALEPGHAFRWYLYDKVAGNPDVSLSRELPFTLSTELEPNTEPVTVELQTGGTRMNYLANPFGGALDLTGIDGWPGGDNVSPNAPVWVYDPVERSFEDAPDQIGPWVVFRVRAKGPRVNGRPRTLTIPVSAVGPTSAARRAPSPRLAFTLEGADAEGGPLADRAFTVVFADDARPAFDADEDAAKLQPPAETYALVGSRADGRLVGYDARPFAAGETTLAVEARGTAAEMTLRWTADLPDGLPVTLVDLATGAEVDVRSQSAYGFRVASRPALDLAPTVELADGAAAEDRFVLRVGDRVAGAQAGVTELALDPVAPNPSSGTARVAFALPEAGPVRVAVYDVRGREVAVLADGEHAAGHHQAALASRSLAAGVYVVRLEAHGQVLTRRAVVVR